MKDKKQNLIIISSIFYVVSLVLVYLVPKSHTQVSNSNKIIEKEVLVSQTEVPEKPDTPTQTNTITPAKEIIKPDQTIIQSESRGGYTIKSIQDDQNSISKLILINNKKEEILIIEEKYHENGYDPGKIIKPAISFEIVTNPGNISNFHIIFKGSNNYGVYNPKYQSKTTFDLDMGDSNSQSGFDNDKEYFYICDNGCMDNCGVAIFDTMVFSLRYYEVASNTCQFNKTDNSLSISTEGSYYQKDKKTFDFKTGFLNSN